MLFPAGVVLNCLFEVDVRRVGEVGDARLPYVIRKHSHYLHPHAFGVDYV